MPPKKNAPLERIMQAVHAVEEGEYNSGMLADLIEQKDDIGQLARVIDTMGRGVAFRYKQLRLLRKVIPIGVALSAEKDFNRLLESLVVEAQSVTNADAGTLYLLEDKSLRFVILRNTSLKIDMGGTSGREIAFNPLPLYNEKGAENRANVATYAALTRQTVTIGDAYETSAGFDFSGTKSFDKNTGYRSKSFLTIPLEGKDKEVIGVLQLINAKDPNTGEIIPFGSDDVLEALVLLASAALAGYIQEEKLRAEIAKLRIEIDESKRDSQVTEITDTQYFKNLKDRAKQFRTERKDK
ncbi:MAG TPA: GAF domain-containing protein [Anaerolineales bacterium]|jgi:GAF domain-containing protein|nr:GAF domain-containing protein [Anaerolineales bacterium]